LKEKISGLEEKLDGIIAGIAGLDGLMSRPEMDFLALLAAHPLAKGDILEIGSFKGRSTVLLAQASQLGDGANVIAVDPLNSPSVTDPDLGGQDSVEAEFFRSLSAGGVEQRVEFHKMLSAELAGRWPAGRRLRLLWIDGDHTYAGVKIDFDGFAGFLDDGGIIAMHDVLKGFDGPIRVFMEEVLLSDRFHAAGMCGSIGWARYHARGRPSQAQLRAKARLYRRLAGMVPCDVMGRPKQGFEKWRYKLARALVPHGAVSYGDWLRSV